MRSCIMDDQEIPNLRDRKFPILGKFVIVFTQTTNNVDYFCLTFWTIEIGDMVVGPVHSRTEEVDSRSIYS